MRDYFVWLAKFLTIVIIFLFIVPLGLVGVLSSSKEVFDAEKIKNKKNVVAVIALEGEITDGKEVLEQLYKQAHSDSVQGIVLRVDSPGGAVGPSQEIYNAIMKLKTLKPIVSSMGSVAASGGLYSAVSASKVLAQPGTMTGSIGVIMQIPNFSKIMGVVGVDVVTIKSGTLKDVGNSFREMNPDEKEYLEKTAHTVHEQFINDIAKARGLSADVVRQFADGRVLLGEEALNLKLIDGYGDVEQAARMVFELRNTPLSPTEKPTLIYPEDKFKEFRKLLDAVSSVPQIFSEAVKIKYIMR